MRMQDSLQSPLLTHLRESHASASGHRLEHKASASQVEKRVKSQVRPSLKNSLKPITLGVKKESYVGVRIASGRPDLVQGEDV